MDHAQHPRDGQAAPVLPNRHLPGVMPSPTPAVCGPFLPSPHLPFSTRQDGVSPVHSEVQVCSSLAPMP